MSATATMVYPTAPPPTKNTLNKEQRSRLLRSSRKLGSLLGTTPLVVDPDTEAETPSSRNVLTRGAVKRHLTGLFQTSQSASASSSSLSVASSSTATSSNDYVHVRPTTNSRSRPGAGGAYQVQAIFDNASPPSSRSASPFPGALPRTHAGASTTSAAGAAAGDHSPTGVSRKRKQQTAGDSVGLAAPLNPIYLGPSTGSNTKLDKGKGSGASASASGAGHHHHHNTSQPLLLRLRSVPTTDDINNRNGQLDDSSHSHSPPKALSPVTSTFNMNMSVDVLLPPSPSTMSVNAHTHGLSDRERRRKMAKLARTLGENIPPELVFGSSATQNDGDNLPSSTARQPTTLTRRASASAATTLRRKNLQEPRDHALESFAPFHYTHDQPKPSTQFNATASLPPLAVAAVPQPTARNSSDNINHPHLHPHTHRQHPHPHQTNHQPPPEWERHEPHPSHLRPSAQAEKLVRKRLNRPRSLTLGTASAFAAATALLSRKADPEPEREPEPEPEHESTPPAPVVPIIIAPPPPPKPRTIPMPTTDDDAVLSRGTTSLDLDSLPSSPRTRSPHHTYTHARAHTFYDGSGYGTGLGSGTGMDDLPSPRPFVHIVDATPFDLARSSIDSARPPAAGTELAGTLTVDWGRRKEREWSGEWNLKDMEDVAKKLRGLKGR